MNDCRCHHNYKHRRGKVVGYQERQAFFCLFVRLLGRKMMRREKQSQRHIKKTRTVLVRIDMGDTDTTPSVHLFMEINDRE